MEIITALEYRTLKPCQWVETSQPNFCIYPMDIRIFLTSWFYAEGIDTDVKYRCLRMLDGLVFSHPSFSPKEPYLMRRSTVLSLPWSNWLILSPSRWRRKKTGFLSVPHLAVLFGSGRDTGQGPVDDLSEAFLEQGLGDVAHGVENGADLGGEHNYFSGAISCVVLLIFKII